MFSLWTEKRKSWGKTQDMGRVTGTKSRLPAALRRKIDTLENKVLQNLWAFIHTNPVMRHFWYLSAINFLAQWSSFYQKSIFWCTTCHRTDFFPLESLCRPYISSLAINLSWTEQVTCVWALVLDKWWLILDWLVIALFQIVKLTILST